LPPDDGAAREIPGSRGVITARATVEDAV